ncbi:long-chain fatty acid--CoA ligase [Azospirillum sp. Vi22]|uniref:class I adenylate-forming enzyme family protein n=1 Tax=Azospirillum baldaniorum TaxID=1064539 RepID=UPI0011A0E9B3|nr:fatty acid--CoA ligase family protein [Azospirillum baldaniorum]NUB04889.1 long-chain fatty acid--CoA ligase [Azospirillum baldaniorum]TWA60616.1 acyl-CoA synthetase (AMP-forming)/AMP-acid ligase II [Azospirillum baldaniorum]
MHKEIISNFARFGEEPSLVFHGEVCTYGGLSLDIGTMERLLDERSVAPGGVVAIEGTYSPKNCALLLALIANGNIVVPLPPGPAAKRQEYLDVSEAECRIAPAGNGEWTVERTGRDATHALYGRLRGLGAPGLVLFSSGTTGRSKASVLNFAKLLGRYDTTQRRPRRTLAFLSLDHIGGINTLMHTLSQGGCIVTVAERTPRAIFKAIEAHKVDTLPTTPTFLTMCLMSGEATRHDLSSLRLITYGTEPMPMQTLRKLNAALPQVRLKQTYGLSEVGILPTASRSNDSLWVKLGTSGFDHKIIDGILWIRSDMAMLGYLNAPAAFDEDGYFNTQDAVEVDGEYVRILGRKSELINVGGEKVYPNEVESVLLEVDNVVEATVSGKPNAVTGMVVQALVRVARPEPPQQTVARIREHCRGRLQPFKIPALIDVTDREQHSDRFKKVRVAS